MQNIPQLPFNVRTLAMIAPGRVNVNIDISPLANLTSADVQVIEAFIAREEQFSNTPMLPGVNRFSLFALTLEGEVRRGGVAANHRKIFQFHELRNWRNLLPDLHSWSLGFIGPNHDYSMDIEKILFVFVSNRGGCGRSQKTIKCGRDVFREMRASNNNCFFRVLAGFSDEIGRISKTACNLIRDRFNIPHDTMITIADAERIIGEYCPLSRFFILMDESDRWIPHEPTDDEKDDSSIIKIRLKDEHYQEYMGPIFSHKCPRCYKTYSRLHSCVADSYPKCMQCGAHHSGLCNPNKLSFFQTQIMKSDSRVCSVKEKIGALNNDNIVHYDIESVPDSDHVHQPYTIGCSSTKYGYIQFVGKQCMKVFISWLLISFPDKKELIYLNAFNGANFDHYILIKEWLRMKLPIEDFLLNNGSIIGASLKNFRLFDLRKHCVGSLDSNLKAWKCAIMKGSFDHNRAVPWEEMAEEMKTACSRYLKADVEGLRELYEKINATIYDNFDVNVYPFISISQLTYYNWLLKTSAVLEAPTRDSDTYYRGAIYGGRVYKSKHEFISSQRDGFLAGEIDFDEIDDFIVDLDVVSLYPAAMNEFEYPHGETFRLCDPINIGVFNKHIAEKSCCSHMGIFHIKFKPNTKLAHAILPRRLKSGLKWTLEPGEGFYTSVDIDNALASGYSIEITRQGGYFWREKGFIFKEYITLLFERKKNSEKGSPNYLAAKLAMNGLYGKLIQRPVEDESVWLEKNSDVFKFFQTHRILELVDFNDQMYVRGISRDDSKVEKKKTKPSYLGAFVLAYSRSIMLKYMKASNPFFDSSDTLKKTINDIYYTDTDSIQIHNRNALEQCRDLGGITDDLGSECKILRGYWIAPKLYMLEYIKKDNDELLYHFKGKGVPQGSLNVEMYEFMNWGGSVSTCRDFTMKKIHTKRNSKQTHLELFSILHESWEHTIRNLNSSPWMGRVFLTSEGVNIGSLPIGYT